VLQTRTANGKASLPLVPRERLAKEFEQVRVQGWALFIGGRLGGQNGRDVLQQGFRFMWGKRRCSCRAGTGEFLEHGIAKSLHRRRQSSQMMTCDSFGPQVLPIIPGNAARQSCNESGGELILEEEQEQTK